VTATTVDLDGGHWGGSVPIRSVWGAPEDAADLSPGLVPPAAVAALTGRPL